MNTYDRVFGGIYFDAHADKNKKAVIAVRELLKALGIDDIEDKEKDEKCHKNLNSTKKQ